jgi:hypothetical protein
MSGRILLVYLRLKADVLSEERAVAVGEEGNESF